MSLIRVHLCRSSHGADRWDASASLPAPRDWGPAVSVPPALSCLLLDRGGWLGWRSGAVACGLLIAGWDGGGCMRESRILVLRWELSLSILDSRRRHRPSRQAWLHTLTPNKRILQDSTALQERHPTWWRQVSLPQPFFFPPRPAIPGLRSSLLRSVKRHRVSP